MSVEMKLASGAAAREANIRPASSEQKPARNRARKGVKDVEASSVAYEVMEIRMLPLVSAWCGSASAKTANMRKPTMRKMYSAEMASALATLDSVRIVKQSSTEIAST